jgi:DUF4097 and DUF4098 domain-containing protein YvlB
MIGVSAGWRGMAISAGLMAMGLVAADASAQQSGFEWAGDMRSGSSLTVEGISGDVHATLASGSRAEVVARKTGNRDHFDRVDIKVEERDGDVVVCAVYGRRAMERTGCGPWDSGDWGEWDEENRIDVSVEFDVRVPAGVDFEGTTISGDVEVEGLRSEVTATSVSGDVRVSTRGVVTARTVSGELDLTIDSMDWDDLEFNTVSGDIRVRLPAGLNARVDFSSLSGDFESDFDIGGQREDKGRWVGRQVEGVIGEGGRRLSLSTVSGDVELLRLR